MQREKGTEVSVESKSIESSGTVPLGTLDPVLLAMDEDHALAK